MPQSYKIYMFSLCLMLLLSACGGKSPDPSAPQAAPVDKPQDVTWEFRKNGISLIITAVESLNVVDEIPHAVSICIYQTANMDLVKAKAETEVGLRELLLCKSSPPERIQAQRIYVQPSSTLEMKLDRAETAKYMLVIAGFNVLNPENSFSSMQFPMHEGTERSWVFFTKDIYNAADVNARIDISTESIHLQGVERVQK